MLTGFDRDDWVLGIVLGCTETVQRCSYRLSFRAETIDLVVVVTPVHIDIDGHILDADSYLQTPAEKTLRLTHVLREMRCIINRLRRW